MIHGNKNKICRSYLGDENLYHGLLGEMMKGHKYIAREENAAGSKNKYTYFYTEEALNAFKSAKNSVVDKVSSITQSVTSSVQNGYQKLKNLFSSREGSKTEEEIKAQAKENARDNHESMRLINQIVAKFDGVFGKSYKKVNTTARYTADSGEIVNGSKNDKDSRGFKYVGKIRMPPKNEWRYYYSDDAFKAGIATYNYRKADDSYMNRFDTIADDNIGYSTRSRGNDSNPGHRKEGDYRGINCIYCTLATELRTRGYDVQAKDVPSIDSRSTITSLFGLERKIETKNISIRASSDYTEGKYSSSVNNGKVTVTRELTDTDHIKDLVPAMFDSGATLSADNKVGVNLSRVAKQMASKIESSFPPGARGNFSIYWNSGGGHSEFWEIDENGKLHIYDTQGGTEKEDSLESLIKHADPLDAIEFLRFDDCAIVDPTIIKDSIEPSNKSKSK